MKDHPSVEGLVPNPLRMYAIRSGFRPRTNSHRSIALPLFTVAFVMGFSGSTTAALISGGSMITERADHVAALLSNGKVLVAGGYYLNTAELFDPATGLWSTTGSMSTNHFGATATVLLDGTVLVAGGHWASRDGIVGRVTDRAELYDPASGTWTRTGNLKTPRSYHTATLLPDGRVFVFSGFGTNVLRVHSAELYDPGTRTWSTVFDSQLGLEYPTATLLPNGLVLVLGGFVDGYRGGVYPTSGATVYDPVARTREFAASMVNGRGAHTATLLPNGLVLIAGGSTGSDVIAACELYDPATKQSTLTGSLNSARAYHTATLLPNGTVLVTGGRGTNSVALASMEIYDPATGVWTPAGVMSANRESHTATLLPSGAVLLAGGNGHGSGARVDLYDSAAPAWAETAPMLQDRASHTATLLTDGSVLVVGGFRPDSTPPVLATCELYRPAQGSWTATGMLNTPRDGHTATLLPGGKVLVAGGETVTTPPDTFLASAELYDPATGTWSNTSPMSAARYRHTATMLVNGKVLICGGATGAGPVGGAEIFDPAMRGWTSTAPLNTPRADHTATLLPNGKVLVVGGNNANTPLTSAELYDPVSGTWTSTGSLNAGRWRHFAVLLPNGQVMVGGGGDQTSNLLSIVEIYNPVSGTWRSTGNLQTPTYSERATLLANGRVLVVGGNPWCVQLYDPMSEAWSVVNTAATTNTFACCTATATLLPDGKVLIAGGSAVTGLFDPDLGKSRPQISGISSPIVYGQNIVVSGSPFRGVSEASLGNSRSSGADYPVVQLRALDSGWTTFLVCSSWTTNSFVSGPVTGFPVGPGLANVSVNGNVSESRFVLLTSGTNPATVTLGNLSQVYDGTPREVSVTTVPAGLPAGITYSGSPHPPIAAGSYDVVATISDPVYFGSATNTLVVSKAPATVTLGNLDQAYDGTRRAVTVTTVPPGLTVDVTYIGSFGAPTFPGTYTVVATVMEPNYSGAVTNTLVVTKAPVQLIVGSLRQAFDGAPKPVSVAVSVEKLVPTVTYNGSANAPSAVGNYTVVALINDPNYQGGATNTLVITPMLGVWTTNAPRTTASYGTATVLQNGKVLATGTSAELFDPNTGTWAPTGPPHVSRPSGFTATVLPNGKVLVVGGYSDSFAAIAAAELYDPATGNWTSTASMHHERATHTATLLSDGKVLVAGGRDNANESVFTAEIYDPATATWTFTASMATSRFSQTATLLRDGRVLVAGGFGGTNAGSLWSPVSSAEIYDPFGHVWTSTGSMAAWRADHTATLLADGKVLVAGGAGGDAGRRYALCELYDPSSGTWSATGSLNLGRASGPTATLMSDGRVLVTGGWNPGVLLTPSMLLTNAEVYDPMEGAWTLVGLMSDGHAGGAAALLPNGKVLITGNSLKTDVWDPAIGAWEPAIWLRGTHGMASTTLLPNGSVLMVGGQGASRNAELYDPVTGNDQFTGAMIAARYSHTATLLPDGQVLVAGGYSGTGPTNSAELYNPASNAWTQAGPMTTPRQNHTATLLPNGRVLVAGGDPIGRSVELYDPSTSTWRATASMMNARSNHTATLLPDGMVLVAGGQPGAPNSAELYYPPTETWMPTPPLIAGRSSHTATLLPNGKVLVAGGSGPNGPLNSAELYDPSTHTWTATGSLATPRSSHMAILLPNGKVLVSGGDPDSDSAELYDPATGKWTLTAQPYTARVNHTATLLLDGRVLCVGGMAGPNALNNAEIYDVQSCVVGPGFLFGQGATGSWEFTGTMRYFRGNDTATLLNNGKVLVIGGLNDSASVPELFDIRSATWRTTYPIPNARNRQSAVLMANGDVLVTGGQTDYGWLADAERYTPGYEPYSNGWHSAGSMQVARIEHSSTSLPDGRVLVTGGSTPGVSLALALTELYDGTTWTVTGAMNVPRAAHTATLLANGKVLVAGGSGPAHTEASAELYDPVSGIWTLTNPMQNARRNHAAVRLANGKVLVAGGYGATGSSASAEIYDLATGTWTTTPPMPVGIDQAAGALLPNGRVLVFGGKNSALYDPITAAWTVTPAMNEARIEFGMTPLPDGRVLVAGGHTATGGDLLRTAEFFNAHTTGRPEITPFNQPLRLGTNFVVSGYGFRGSSEGSCGNSHDSPSDYPIVQLRSLVNDQSLFLPCAGWTPTSFVSASIQNFPPGYARVTVFVNGIPSMSRIVPVRQGDATVLLSNLWRVYDGTPKPVSVSTVPAGLTAKVTYNGSPAAPSNMGVYAVVATIDDPIYSGVATGTLIIGMAPAATTLVATGVSNSVATLNGTVQPNGFPTAAWFEWGTSTAYGNRTPVTAVGNGFAVTDLVAALGGLAPCTTYHCRVVATNFAGATYGNDAPFAIPDTTPPVIVLNGANPLTNKCHVPYSDPGATATDACAGDVPVSPSGTVDFDRPGEYVITYVASDPSYNTSTQTRLVVVSPDVPSPFIAMAGNYEGLFYDADHGITLSNAGYVTIDVSPQGQFTGQFQRGTDNLRFSGRFASDGSCSIDRIRGEPGWVAWLQLDMAGRDVISGQVSDGSWTATVQADRAVYGGTNPAPQAGQYTLVIPGSADPVRFPGGNGAAAVSVNSAGKVVMRGQLGDGTPVAEDTFVSKRGRWPLYVTPYPAGALTPMGSPLPSAPKGGILIGWINFSNNLATLTDMEGSVGWVKSADAGARLYPDGFHYPYAAGTNNVFGSKFTKSMPLLSWSHGAVILEDGNLDGTVSNDLAFVSDSKVYGPNRLKLTIRTSGSRAGLFDGEVMDPDTGRMIPVQGALFQKQDCGYGWFLGTNQSGSVFLGPLDSQINRR